MESSNPNNNEFRLWLVSFHFDGQTIIERVLSNDKRNASWLSSFNGLMTLLMLLHLKT